MTLFSGWSLLIMSPGTTLGWWWSRWRARARPRPTASRPPKPWRTRRQSFPFPQFPWLLSEGFQTLLLWGKSSRERNIFANQKKWEHSTSHPFHCWQPQLFDRKWFQINWRPMLFFAILLHYYVLYFGAVAVDSARCMFVMGWLVTCIFNRSSLITCPFS